MIHGIFKIKTAITSTIKPTLIIAHHSCHDFISCDFFSGSTFEDDFHILRRLFHRGG